MNFELYLFLYTNEMEHYNMLSTTKLQDIVNSFILYKEVQNVDIHQGRFCMV